MAKEKSQTEKLEEALFVSWRKREKFVMFCRGIGFSIEDLLSISGQCYLYESN